MVSIAWRLSLSRRRSLSWRLRRLSSSDGDLDELRAASPSPETRMQSVERLALVQRYIRELPPKLRDALLLAAAGDLTQDELAAALNVPAATFRGRVREARMRLKEKLKQAT